MSLLRDLYALGKALEDKVLPEGFRQSHVDVIVHLDSDGEVLEVLIEQDRKLNHRIVPDSSRTSGNQAHLVVDKLEYVVAWPTKGVERAELRHAEYLRLLREAMVEVDDESAAALHAVKLAIAEPGVLSDRIRETVGEEPDKGWSELGSWMVDFVVDGRRIFGDVGGDRPDIVKWWTDRQREVNAADGEHIRCQVSGQMGSAARLFPATKLPGNQPRLVATNFPSTYRYGAEQAEGSGVTLEGASVATRALNWLLTTSEERSRIRLGEAVAVAWLPDDLNFEAFGSLDPPSASDVAQLLASDLWAGRPNLSADSRVHLAVLGVNSARVVVLVEHSSTLASFQERLRSWYSAMSPVVRANPRAFLGLYNLAAGVVRADSVRRPSNNPALRKALTRVAVDLFRSAVLGVPISISIRNQTVNRCAVGSVLPNGDRVHVTDAQAALLHIYNTYRKEDAMTSEAAELCGRILAELERIQQDAIGDVGHGVGQSYAAASATPELVFGRLLASRPAHLRKLKRDKPGMAVRSDQRLDQLMAALLAVGGFPRFLDHAGRSRFALGYYDQRQLRYVKQASDQSDLTKENQQHD